MQESAPTQERKPLAVLKSGEKVFDRYNSHIHANPSVEKCLPLALERIDTLGKEFVVESINFGETIGESNCIETNENDKIVYAQRVGRKGISRFVLDKPKSPTSELTVILKKIENGYIVITAFAGPKAEPEPWDQNATANSEQFWSTHALVWGSDPIIPGTESVASTRLAK